MAGGGGLREIELGRFELDPVLFKWQLDAPNDCSMPGSCRIAIRKLNGSLGSDRDAPGRHAARQQRAETQSDQNQTNP